MKKNVFKSNIDAFSSINNTHIHLGKLKLNKNNDVGEYGAEHGNQGGLLHVEEPAGSQRTLLLDLVDYLVYLHFGGLRCYCVQVPETIYSTIFFRNLLLSYFNFKHPFWTKMKFKGSSLSRNLVHYQILDASAGMIKLCKNRHFMHIQFQAVFTITLSASTPLPTPGKDIFWMVKTSYAYLNCRVIYQLNNCQETQYQPDLFAPVFACNPLLED